MNREQKNKYDREYRIRNRDKAFAPKNHRWLIIRKNRSMGAKLKGARQNG